jgi:hypothetical protein
MVTCMLDGAHGRMQPITKSHKLSVRSYARQCISGMCGVGLAPFS